MRTLLVVTSLALMGCEYNAPVALHGDETFTVSERSDVERGNEWIAERLGRSAYPIVWDLPHPDDVNAAPRLSIVRGMSADHRGSVGFEEPDRRVQVDPDNAGENEVALVTAHEMGHMFGLSHHDGPGVMSATGAGEVAGALTWTPQDQAACERAGLCQ